MTEGKGTGAAARAAEWSGGKLLVLTAAMGVGLSAIPVYSMGVFIEPLNREFGWTTSEIVFAQAIMSLIVGVGAPLAGGLLDRFGSRPLAMSGIILISAGMAALGLIHGEIALYYALWAVMAIAITLCSAVIWMRSVISRFHVSRGLAVSLSLCGSNFAGAVSPLIAVTLATTYGWRTAYFGLGIYMLLSTLPLAYFYLRDTQHRTSQTDGQPAPTVPGRTVRQALGQANFWIMATSFLLAGGGITAFIVNLVPMLASRGVSLVLAASAVSGLSIAAIVGRISAGALMDRFFAPRLACIALLLPVPASLLLLFGPATFGFGLIAAILVGLSTGAEFNMLSYLVSRYFGLKSYGTTSGIMFSAFTLGSVFAPALTAKTFEWFGSYDFALYGLAIAFAVASALMLFTGRYPDFETEQPG